MTLKNDGIVCKKSHFSLEFFKIYGIIIIETLWCTTSHLSVDRLFFVLLGKQKTSNSVQAVSRGSSFS